MTERTTDRTDRRRERGAAAVEFAIVVPLLVLLSLGLIDVSDATLRSASAVSASRAAAITAFDAGNDRMHDHRVLGTLVTELDNRGITGVDRVVIFDATATDTVPPACLGAAALAAGGVVDTCVVYDAAFLDRIRADTAEFRFYDPCSPGSEDEQWCADTRAQLGGWRVGIHFAGRQSVITGVLPWFQSYEIAETVVVEESNRD